MPLFKCRGRREGQASADACGPPANKMQAAGTTGAAENTRPSLRDGLHAYTQSAWCTGLVGHHVATTRLRALRWTPASGCRHAATSRPRQAVRPRIRRHAAAPSRPSPPRLACRDDRAQRPSAVRRDGEIKSRFRKNHKRFIFFRTFPLESDRTLAYGPSGKPRPLIEVRPAGQCAHLFVFRPLAGIEAINREAGTSYIHRYGRRNGSSGHR